MSLPARNRAPTHHHHTPTLTQILAWNQRDAIRVDDPRSESSRGRTVSDRQLIHDCSETDKSFTTVFGKRFLCPGD